MQWTLCSVKEGNGKETHMQPDTHNRTDEKSLNAKGITTYASFDIDIPQPSDFERQMEIQANLQPSELVGQLLNLLKIRHFIQNRTES